MLNTMHNIFNSRDTDVVSSIKESRWPPRSSFV